MRFLSVNPADEIDLNSLEEVRIDILGAAKEADLMPVFLVRFVFVFSQTQPAPFYACPSSSCLRHLIALISG